MGAVDNSTTNTPNTTNTTNTNEKTGITMPLAINVPNTLKIDTPTTEVKSSDGTCPPCPPCARCPEPSFECKKVPKYRSLMINDHAQIPRPINPDYTTYAM